MSIAVIVNWYALIAGTSITGSMTPGNDNCGSAVQISPGQASGTMNGATLDGGGTCGDGLGGWVDVWYALTAPQDGWVSLSATSTTNWGGTWDPAILNAVQGNCGALTCVSHSLVLYNTSPAVSFFAPAGSSYLVQLATVGGSSFVLDYQFVAAPSNNNCSTAQAIAPGQTPGTMNGATLDGGGTCGDGLGGWVDVWYALTAPQDGWVSLSATSTTNWGGTWDPAILNAVQGNCGALTCVSHSLVLYNTSPAVSFFAPAGSSYLVQLATVGGSSFVLDYQFVAAPRLCLQSTNAVSINCFLGTTIPTPKYRTVTNCGGAGGNLAWSVQESPSVAWLSESPSLGVIAAGGSGTNVAISFNVNGLPVGAYGTTLQFRNDANPANSFTVPVTLTVQPAPGVQSSVKRLRKLLYAYYADWTQSTYPPSIALTAGLTHVTHFSIWPSQDGLGHLEEPTGFLNPNLNTLAHANGTKVIVAVGGGNRSAGFSAMAGSPSARSTFIGEIANFVNSNQYDGVDIDWEFPLGWSDGADLTQLVYELRSALGSSKEINIALPPGQLQGVWFDVAALQPYVDYFLLMTYDFAAGASLSTHNAPLHAASCSVAGSVLGSVSDWTIVRGIPPSKCILGLPFYGRGFGTQDLCETPNASWLPPSGYDELTYRGISALGGFTSNWDSACAVPYLTKNVGPPYELWTYDDTKSLDLKANVVFSRSLAGAMIWELTGDIVNGTHQLLPAISAKLR